MNKKLLYIITGIFILSIVSAGIILNNKEIFLDEKIVNELREINLDNYNSYDKEINNDYNRILNKKICYNIVDKFEYAPDGTRGNYNIVTTKCNSILSVSSKGFNNTKDLDNWEKEKINQIAEVSIKRKNEQDIIILNEENIIVKENIYKD